MDPSRKRAIRLTIALTVALLLASALVYTSFASGRDEFTASQLLKRAKPGNSYILAGTVLDGSVHRDGPVTVAVSTGGLSPAFASWLRDRLAAECGENAGALAALIGEARERLRRAGRPSDSVDWAALLDGPLLDLVRAGDWDNALAIVAAAVAQ